MKFERFIPSFLRSEDQGSGFNILKYATKDEILHPDITRVENIRLYTVHILSENGVEIPVRVESSPKEVDGKLGVLVKHIYKGRLVFGEIDLHRYGVTSNSSSETETTGTIRLAQMSECKNWFSRTIQLDEEEVLPSSLAFYKESCANNQKNC